MKPVCLVVCGFVMLVWSTASRCEPTELDGRVSLELAMLGDARVPELLLAERAIERQWGQSEDSVYTTLDVPDWRSEGAALAMSSAIPGLGQAYVGEKFRGLLFAAAEVAGWTANLLWSHRGDDLQNQAADYAGIPSDSTSRWSFTRWEEATGQPAVEMRALYVGDRDVFFDRLAHDPTYMPGWTGTGEQGEFEQLRDKADDRLRYARHASTVIWINHIAAGVDALRLARLHNIQLRSNLGLRLDPSMNHRRPGFMATLTRNF